MKKYNPIHIFAFFNGYNRLVGNSAKPKSNISIQTRFNFIL